MHTQAQVYHQAHLRQIDRGHLLLTLRQVNKPSTVDDDDAPEFML